MTSGGVATELPFMPQILIENYGQLQLPLTDPEAKRLIKLSRQAPYGHGYETLVDTSVRDTFEIAPSQISFKSPDWPTKLKVLVDRVAAGLGCTAEVKSSLYKLLIYKKGGHFKKHVDTEKEKDMFATLVIQLPSIHEGGQMVIHHGAGTKKTTTCYDFSAATNPKAASTPHFIAHYADVEHEILEVTSGYRVALTYSLCWRNNGNGTGRLRSNEDIAGRMVKVFSRLNEREYRIGILLKHKYTKQSLQTNGIRALKGRDNEWFNLLREVNDRLGAGEKLCFHIASAEMEAKYGLNFNA